MTRLQELKLLEHYTKKLTKDIPDPQERCAFARTLCSDIEVTTPPPCANPAE